MHSNNIGKDFLDTAIRRLFYYRELGERAFAQLDEQGLHFRPNEESNSVAVIVQHLHGNMMSRWTNFLTEDGEKEWRQRDDEFEVHTLTKELVLDLWQKGWDCFLGALKSLTVDDLLKTVYIRKEALTVIDAINRQLAHYPYHVGQIIYIGKFLKGQAWESLSIPKNQSRAYDASNEIKDPAKKIT